MKCIYSRKAEIMSSKRDDSDQKGLGGMSGPGKPEEPRREETEREAEARRQVPAGILPEGPKALQAEAYRDSLQRNLVCDGQAGGGWES